MAKDLVTVVRSVGGEILPDNDRYTNRFKIPNSNGTRMYIVAQAKSGVNAGQWSCGCPGWISRRNCKHLKALLPGLQQIGKTTYIPSF